MARKAKTIDRAGELRWALMQLKLAEAALGETLATYWKAGDPAAWQQGGRPCFGEVVDATGHDNRIKVKNSATGTAYWISSLQLAEAAGFENAEPRRRQRRK